LNYAENGEERRNIAENRKYKEMKIHFGEKQLKNKLT